MQFDKYWVSYSKRNSVMPRFSALNFELEKTNISALYKALQSCDHDINTLNFTFQPTGKSSPHCLKVDMPRFETLWKIKIDRVCNLTVTYFHLVNGTKYCGGTTLATLAAENKSHVLKKLIAKRFSSPSLLDKPTNDPISLHSILKFMHRK